MKLPVILLSVFVTGFAATASAQLCNITVNISNLKNDKGIVYASLYNSADGYPKNAKKAVRLAYCTISNGRCTIVFDGMPRGTYAIACYHDENNNGKLDVNFLGIPKEGTGASNNAKGFMGPPKFNAAAFVVGGNITQEIKMNE